MQPTDTDLPWLLTLPGLVTAVATSLAALFTGLAWRSSRYGLGPVIEVVTEGRVDEPQILKLLITRFATAGLSLCAWSKWSCYSPEPAYRFFPIIPTGPATFSDLSVRYS